LNNFGGSIILKIKSNLTSFINNLPQLLKKIRYSNTQKTYRY
jgi:hypothetical protein